MNVPAIQPIQIDLLSGLFLTYLDAIAKHVQSGASGDVIKVSYAQLESAVHTVGILFGYETVTKIKKIVTAKGAIWPTELDQLEDEIKKSRLRVMELISHWTQPGDFHVPE